MNDEVVFIKICDNPLGFMELLKIPNSDKSIALARLTEQGYKSVTIMNTKNRNADKLGFSAYGDGGYGVYHATREFINKFGPFDEVETIDLDKTITEGSRKYELLFGGCVVRTPRPGGGFNYSIT